MVEEVGPLRPEAAGLRQHGCHDAFGRPLLVDAGRFDYAKGPFRDYFVGSASHNVLLIDGAGQNATAERAERPWEDYGSTPDLDYARAVVPDETTGELRGSRLRHAALRFEHDLARRLGLWVEGGTQRNHSADPFYTHGRRWLATGLRYGT